MTDTSLKDRLRDHSEAFDSLLSLIPAKLYYGEEQSDQWQRKKQTKEQARAAKRNKLDPDSALNRSAKEEDLEGVEREKPLEGLKKRNPADGEPSKKVKLSEPEADDESKAEKLSAHQQKKLLKQQKKAEKKAEKKKTKVEKAPKKTEAVEKDEPASADENEDDSAPADDPSKDMRPIDVSGLADEDVNRSASSSFSVPASPTFDTNDADKQSAEQGSTTTSIASEAAPTEKSKKIKVPSDTTELRARLAAKIAALRAARKADGPEGTPIRTRQELIESRRKKLAERKAHKKELRIKAKEAEDKKREEALASARNSPMLSFGSPEHDSLNFTFGRVAFADGTAMSHDLSYIKDKSGKKKGPQDPKGALAKLEAQKKRLASLDEDKRKEVLEKETWLAARKKAEGEKVRNDESLLKKAVKRKDKAKKKSEKEWKDRISGVEYGQKQRQQKRDENIRKRKETKQAGKAGKKKGKSPTKKKTGGRPGFEGGGFGGGKRK
ncbi:Ribosomal RNA-processing protein 14 [Cytospora mali]|uniref:Ribosomal RNA-processing protein 14 n=1 Tax=Cytospora mali TaxID=578113 RepID=A0A194V2U2_CYTMA|nr:Ribosomal RNA-processing protein 14 [Valsa mali var. pyri (nom. inval.)]